MNGEFQILVGDCLRAMDEVAPESVQCAVTSPPYFQQRDYGMEWQVGLERTVHDYIARLVERFEKVRQVLKPRGTLWVIIGDTYAGGGCGGGGSFAIDRLHLANKNHTAAWKRNGRVPAGFQNKQLIGIPWRLAFALQESGWLLRQDCIWHKPNPMPESCRDRCTKAHEYIFHFAKSENYYFDSRAVREVGTYPAGTKGGKASAHRFYEYKVNSRPMRYKIYDGFRNKRSVWTVATKPSREKHYATFPPELIEPCILASTRLGDIVLDPFGGTGTTMEVALKNGRRGIAIDNATFARVMRRRCEAIFR